MPVVENDVNGGGEWGALEDWPLIGIHAILTLDHELLTFGTDERGMQSGETVYDVWNYETETHYTLQNTTGTDIFCSVPVMIAETGEILIVGGDSRPLGFANRGVDDVNIFNPDDRSIRTMEDDLTFARWYATAVTMPNGDIVVLGGIDGGGGAVRTPEIYSAETGWKQLPGAATDAVSNGGNWWYPKAWPMSDGRIIITSQSNDALYIMDVTGGGSTELYGNLGFNHTFELPAIMVGEDLMLFAADNDRAYLVDISGDTPIVSDAGFIGDRVWGEMTIMANGDVLISGGSEVANGGVENKTAVIWDRDTNTITQTGEAEDNARLYHSTAMLLPDGSILSLGGGAPGPYVQTNGQRYYPDYMYDENGNLADRIEIIDAPRNVDSGDSFTITVDDPGAVARITMIKHGAVTHSFNMETRYHEPEFTVNADGTIVITPDANAGVVTPGAWMVFVMDEDDVPSEAISVMIATDEDYYGDTAPVVIPGFLGDATLQGTSQIDADGTIILTADEQGQAGSVTGNQKIDFSRDFELSLEVFLGENDAGADGIAIVFHNNLDGSAIGGLAGGGLGVTDAQNGFAIKLDTYTNFGELGSDFGVFYIPATGEYLSEAFALPQLEDGQFHDIAIVWDASAQVMAYSVDGVVAGTLNADVVAQYLGNNEASLSIGAATGGATNLQAVRDVQLSYDGEMVNATPLKGILEGAALLGNATAIDTNTIQLTAGDSYQAGGVSSGSRIDFSEAFEVSFEMYLGDNEAGADGIGLTFHNDGAGQAAQGSGGNGLGTFGIQNGITLKFDTYSNINEINSDFSGFVRSSDYTALTENTPLEQLEDGQFHLVKMRWDPQNQTLSYSVDDTSQPALVQNLTADIFGGDLAWMYLSGSSGLASNEHLIRNVTFNGMTEEGPIGVPPVGGDTITAREWPGGLQLLGGARQQDDGSSFELTADVGGTTGAIATNDRVDFSKNFVISMDLYLGANDAGADGIAVVFHNDARGVDAIGTAGNGFGVAGIQNGFGIEFDTYQNPGEIAVDHTNFIDSENFSSLTAGVDLGQIEDGQFHAVMMMWDAGTQTLMYTVDGQMAGRYVGDLSEDFFGGADSAHLVVGAATGGLTNQHLVRDIRLMQGEVVDGPEAPSTVDLTTLMVLNGDANLIGDNIVLTPDEGSKVGTAGFEQKIDMTKDFEISANVFLGTKDANGADGMSFVFHNDAAGANAIGLAGGFFGAGGINDGFGLEIDTFQNFGEIGEDHFAFFNSDDLAPQTQSTAIGNIEDGQEHELVLGWNAASSTMTASLDGNVISDFDASSLLDTNGTHLTITAGTGGLANEQYVSDIIFDGFFLT